MKKLFDIQFVAWTSTDFNRAFPIMRSSHLDSNRHDRHHRRVGCVSQGVLREMSITLCRFDLRVTKELLHLVK